MVDIDLLGVKLLQDRLNTVSKDTEIGELKQLIREACEACSSITLFELNDVTTRTAFKNILNPILEDWKSRGFLDDYAVVADQTNNTKKVIDANQFVADIYVRGPGWTEQPPPAAYRLNFIVAPTGLEFEKIAEAK